MLKVFVHISAFVHIQVAQFLEYCIHWPKSYKLCCTKCTQVEPKITRLISWSFHLRKEELDTDAELDLWITSLHSWTKVVPLKPKVLKKKAVYPQNGNIMELSFKKLIKAKDLSTSLSLHNKV